MPRPPRIFLSFSSQDKPVVRKLFYSFKSQNLDVWDYSETGSELPIGERLPEALARRIEASDYFIAVLSANSTDPHIGRYTCYEVEHAVKIGMLERGKLLPVVLAPNPPIQWAGAHQQLRDIVHLILKPEPRREYEGGIARLCQRMGWPYTPPFLGDPRLPLAERFHEEIKSLALPVAVFNELMLLADEFARHFAEGNWLEADELISYFLMTCRYKAPHCPLYYPLIVKGVCQLQLGRFLEAEQTFLEAARHPARDENSYGGLGQVYFRQQRYPEALAAFRKSLELCPPEKSLEIRLNILATLSQMGEPPDQEQELLERFRPEELPPDDRLRLLNLRGLIQYRKGHYQAALEIFQSLRREGLGDQATAVYHSRALEGLGRVEEAIALLRAEARRLDDTNLYHHLADLCLKAGRSREALEIYEQRLCRPPHRTRQYLVEYARILAALNAGRFRPLIREICQMVVSGGCFELPRTEEDFYYAGFANYLLGNHERARYDYERSRGFSRYYDQIFP